MTRNRVSKRERTAPRDQVEVEVQNSKGGVNEEREHYRRLVGSRDDWIWALCAKFEKLKLDQLVLGVGEITLEAGTCRLRITGVYGGRCRREAHSLAASWIKLVMLVCL